MIITAVRTLKLLDATIYSSLLSSHKYARISSSSAYWLMQLLTFVAMTWDILGVYALVLHAKGTSCDADNARKLLWAVVLSSTLALLKRFIGVAAWLLVRGGWQGLARGQPLTLFRRQSAVIKYQPTVYSWIRRKAENVRPGAQKKKGGPRPPRARGH